MNIELEITLRCDAKCLNCNRHCNMEDLRIDLSNSDMSIKQIEDVIQKIKTYKDVDCIRIIGGEPTLHPNIVEICDLLKKELLEGKIIKRLAIVTHGMRPFDYPLEILTPISMKEKRNEHYCCLVAPIDYNQETIKCRIPKICGIAINKYGIYPCGPGGAIARLFRLNKFIKQDYTETINEWPDLYNLCKYCQLFAKSKLMEKDHGRLISKSFLDVFEKRNNEF